MPTPERRRLPRVEVRRPVKLLCEHTGRSMAGRTVNVSDGGALIEVAAASLMVQGQRLRVGIAWNDRQAVLGDADFAAGTVVRSLGFGSGQQVAVQFDGELVKEPAARAG